MGTVVARIGCIGSIQRKPAGGFCFIRVRSILAAWHAMMHGLISLYDLRIWLGCHELVARRCRIGKDKTPDYQPGELVALLGTGTEPKVRQGIQRLEAAGLLTWGAGGVSADTKRREEAAESDPEWHLLIGSVVNNRRKVPVPRRMICYLVASRSRTLIATVLGHLLRCLYYRKGRCVSGGRCKASWVAETFGVDVRNVKAVRRDLISMGWLEPGEAHQIWLNRWGLPTVISLSWGQPAETGETESPLPNCRPEPKSPPPESNKELSTRSVNQKLGRKAGDLSESGRKRHPTLRKIELEDLRQPARLDSLYRAAVAGGMVPNSPASRLRWFAAAERALATGERNPCGLFVAMYRRGLWHHITQAQEDVARTKLKKLDFGEDSRLPGQGGEFGPGVVGLAA